MLYLHGNQLTSDGDRAAHVAEGVVPQDNQLTSLPAEVGQLTSLTELRVELPVGGWERSNQLDGVPAEIGQLASLAVCGQSDELAAEVGQLVLYYLNLATDLQTRAISRV